MGAKIKAETWADLGLDKRDRGQPLFWEISYYF